MTKSIKALSIIVTLLSSSLFASGAPATYQRVYFDDVVAFPMDYTGVNVQMACGIGEISVSHSSKGELLQSAGGYIVSAYCEMKKEDELGNTHFINPMKLMIMIPDRGDGNAKKVAKILHNNSSESFMFKGKIHKEPFLLFFLVDEVSLVGQTSTAKKLFF